LLWGFALAVLGVVLLLSTFLVLNSVNVLTLLPLTLVILGVVVLLRGDILSGGQSSTFGITRGSVESGIIEINAGEIDIIAHPLQRPERLIAGQYALGARPNLVVQETQAILRMERAATPWLSFADWDVGMAQDLPWTVYISTSLGEVNLDLTGIIVSRVSIGTGLGDIRLTCPQETMEPLELRSAVGSIHVLAPPMTPVRVRVVAPRFANVRVDGGRFEMTEPGVYTARDADPLRPMVQVVARTTFGDITLA
jgi:hypothetical protein